VVSLVANVPLISALANDIGYAEVFVEQLRGLFKEGDLVVAVSASGNSENVLRAARYANDHGGTSIGLVGFDGGKLRDCCHICVHVPTPVGAYELVEDIHHIVCHMLANYVKYKAAHPSGGSSHGGNGD
jgi:D-sedoheptulose 7-phosphate isomerase